MSDQVYATLIKRRRRSGDKVSTSATWYLRYRLPGDRCFSLLNLGVREKTAAEAKRIAWLRDRELEIQGVTPPAILRDAASLTLRQHSDAFTDDLHAMGRSAKYVDNVHRRLGKLFAACGWHLLREVTPERFMAWRARQPKDTAAKTLNEYLDAANALFNWLHRQGKLIANPLRSVAKVETRGRQKRRRRAITDAEFTALLRIAGPRRPVYLAALLTGLRRAELQALRWSDVHLDAVKPFLTARANTTKNKREATIWLRDDLANELRTLAAARQDDEDAPVFADIEWDIEKFKHDLDASGVPYKDAQGRQFDFHSIRKQLATMLHRAGVARRVAMEVMRHTDARLTDEVYTDEAMLPTADALERLPRFVAAEGLRESAATGTDGTHGWTTFSDNRCPSASSDGKTASRSHVQNHPGIPCENAVLDATTQNVKIEGKAPQVGFEPTKALGKTERFTTN